MKKCMLLKAAVLLVCLTVFLTGCKKSGIDTEVSGFSLYYRNQSSMTLTPVAAELDSTMDMGLLINSIYETLQNTGDAGGYVSAVPADLKLNSYSFIGNDLVLDMSDAYPETATNEEILLRASLVLTYSQLDQVSTVEITVNGQPLIYADGTAVGAEKETSFIDVISGGLNDLTEADVILYFSDESGNALVACPRTITYHTTESLAHAILRNLVEGPTEEGCLPILSPDTKILSVTVSKGVCRINFNSEIVNEPAAVEPEAVIAGIVDSLTEVSDISSVIISVNGSRDLSYMEKIDLNTTFTRDLTLVVEDSQETGEE